MDARFGIQQCRTALRRRQPLPPRRHRGLQHRRLGQALVLISGGFDLSVGAVIAATWVHDYAPRLRALVLASPAFKVKLYVPLARPGLALLHRVRGNFFVNSYVKPQWLTHDPARVESYRTDPLITRPISVNILLGLYEAAERVVGALGGFGERGEWGPGRGGGRS